jgi:phospholipid N-methyltransferase
MYIVAHPYMRSYRKTPQNRSQCTAIEHECHYWHEKYHGTWLSHYQNMIYTESLCRTYAYSQTRVYSGTAQWRRCLWTTQHRTSPIDLSFLAIMFSTTLLTSLRTSWAISPYTKKTIQTMVNDIDRDHVTSIVEFGPGEGGITRAILDKLAPDGTLTCFELNQADFESNLATIQDSRLTIHYVSCTNIEHYCPAWSVDHIISTIPLSLIGKETVTQILTSAYRTLNVWWTIISGNYSFWSEKLFSSIFAIVTRSYCLRNIPPVCIVTATKK